MEGPTPVSALDLINAATMVGRRGRSSWWPDCRRCSACDRGAAFVTVIGDHPGVFCRHRRWLRRHSRASSPIRLSQPGYMFGAMGVGPIRSAVPPLHHAFFKALLFSRGRPVIIRHMHTSRDTSATWGVLRTKISSHYWTMVVGTLN